METIAAPLVKNVFDFIYDVNYSKKGDLLVEGTRNLYVPFIINRSLSNTIDTLFFAQELNQFYKISKEEHYKYLLCALPKKKRFAKWFKEEKNEKLEIIMEYYGCSVPKAKELLKLLKPEDLDYITRYLDKGGSLKKTKGKKK